MHLKKTCRHLLLGACRFVCKALCFSECYRAVAHARGRSEGGQSRREDADDDLQDGLPSFFLHGTKFLNSFFYIAKAGLRLHSLKVLAPLQGPASTGRR